MSLKPAEVINAFLDQVKQMGMAVVVFAGYIENHEFRLRSSHTLKEGAEKAFLGQFLATDDRAVEAAAKAIAKTICDKSKWADPWEKLEKDIQATMLEAARAAIEAARNPDRVLVLDGKMPS